MGYLFYVFYVGVCGCVNAGIQESPAKSKFFRAGTGEPAL
jgi:hypothetical protein